MKWAEKPAPRPYKKKETVSTAREAALLSLLEVQNGWFPDVALEKHVRRRGRGRSGAAGAHGLEQRDRDLALALVYGVLRWRSRLDWTIAFFLSRPNKALHPAVGLILAMGAFQLLHLDRIPASAAINEAVKLAKKYGPAGSSGLVNAVLRNLNRAESPPDPAASDLPPLQKTALTHAHPEWMVRRWWDELGPQETEALLAANNKPAPLTIRVNTRLAAPEEVLRRLTAQGFQAVKTRYAPEGISLYGPTGPVDALPGFEEGLFSVQDEAAQLAGLLAKPRPGERVLDACAGRGAKTAQLAAVYDAGLVGLDPDRKRLLQGPVEFKRLRLPRADLVLGDLFQGPLAPDSFDVVLVDAPCSNLGVIRRRPDVKWSKNEPDPARLAELQTRLLLSAASLVKPGGRLVYSVCTLTREETQGVVDGFILHQGDFSLVPVDGFLPESARPLAGPGFLRAWPHKHGADGFFAAVFKKRSGGTL
ncbi:MAG: 16S rRNA (cytosine(967)-C(5))-methyltransferase RsmB [Pseudomonadota bacterium]